MHPILPDALAAVVCFLCAAYYFRLQRLRLQRFPYTGTCPRCLCDCTVTAREGTFWGAVACDTCGFALQCHLREDDSD